MIWKRGLKNCWKDWMVDFFFHLFHHSWKSTTKQLVENISTYQINREFIMQFNNNKKGGISLCGATSCRHENSSSIILYLDMVDKTGAALTFFLTLTKNRRSSLLFLAHLVLDLHGRKKNKIRTPYIYSLLKKSR